MLILIVGIVALLLGVLFELLSEKFSISKHPNVFLATMVISSIALLLKGEKDFPTALVAGLCFVGAWSLADLRRKRITS